MLEAHSASTHHFGFKWWLDLSVGQALPVDASEEGLLSDVSLTLQATAETLWGVLGHQLVTNGGRKRRDGGSLREEGKNRTAGGLWKDLKNVNIEMAYFESLLPSATLCRARLTLNQLIYSYKQSRHLFIAAFFFLNQQPLLISTVNHLLQMKCEENNKRGQDSLSRQRLWDDERYL